MKDKQISPYAIIEKFSRVVKMWQQIEKQPRKFGIDEDLYSAEIHLIEVVGENKDMSVSELAGLMGITKGAISQTLKKLENKDLILKALDPSNSSRFLVKLTAKGKIAFYAHEHWHETMDGGFKAYFTGLPEEKLVFMDNFLTMLENFLGKRT